MLSAADVLLPAAFAGAVAIVVTVAIERLGGRVGGLVATMPSTIVPGALGIHAEAPSPAAFATAMYAVPAAMLLNAGFLYLWRVLPARLPETTLRARLALMTVASLSAWLAGASALVLLEARGGALVPSPRVMAWATALCLAAVGAAACVRAPPALRGSRPVSPPVLLARGALAATAIGLAVAVAATGPAFAAGLASCFPAIFVTTMVSLWLAQGEAVPAGAVGPMMLGSTAVSGYALIAVFALPAWGPVGGTLAAWFGAVALCTLPSWLLLQRLRADR